MHKLLTVTYTERERCFDKMKGPCLPGAICEQLWRKPGKLHQYQSIITNIDPTGCHLGYQVCLSLGDMVRRGGRGCDLVPFMWVGLRVQRVMGTANHLSSHWRVSWVAISHHVILAWGCRDFGSLWEYCHPVWACEILMGIHTWSIVPFPFRATALLSPTFTRVRVWQSGAKEGGENEDDFLQC